MMVVGTTTSSSFFCHLNLFYIYLQSTNIFRQNTTGGLVQQLFLAIANFVVSSRSRFARNIILVENNSFRTSQLTRSSGTLAVTLKKIVKQQLIDE